MLKAVHTGSHQNAQASQAALLHPARPAQAESPLARMQHAFGNQRLLRLANGGMLRGDLVQRKPDKEKADAVPVCNPTPKTLAQMRAITGEPLTLGFTSPEITPLDWQVQFKPANVASNLPGPSSGSNTLSLPKLDGIDSARWLTKRKHAKAKAWTIPWSLLHQWQSYSNRARSNTARMHTGPL